VSSSSSSARGSSGIPRSRAARRSTFSAATAERLRRMLRLHRDLGVNFTGAAIIVDLVERLERERNRSGR